MSNLLEELKKAGLASAKKSKQIEREKKQQEHREYKEKLEPAKVTAKAEQVQQLSPQISLEQQNRHRLEQLYRDAEIGNTGGRRKFYFRGLDDHIECLQMSDLASALIDRGKLAIASNLTLDDYILIKRASALAIEAIDKKRIILLKRKEI